MSLPPIRRQVVVPAGAEVAFEVFTARIGRWWPVASHSVYGDSTVAFEDGRVVERGPAGAEAVWGTVLDWEPPHRLRMTWHPGSDPGKATEVEVSFAPVTDAQTLVTVEHRDRERYADPAAARQEYRQGWPGVLGHYVEAVPGTDGADEGPVWLALLHTPGPAVSGPVELFGHPDFSEHVAFLRRMDAAGVLVAAGPFPASGQGLTVLRLADPVQAAEYVRRAEEDDQSVVRGLLEVQVRPWHVMFTGSQVESP
jgi:uncharacterized protein YndB with AHSA1/START domain/uncharacterized protein YciI